MTAAVRYRACLAAAAGGLLVAGCETTRDKAERLRQGGSRAFEQKGMEVTRDSQAVRVGATHLLSDRNGTAVVVELRNRTPRTLVRVPISIDVLGAGGQPVFENDLAGLEPALVSAAVVRGRESLLWVHDEVQATGRPRRVRARVGETRARPPARLPEIAISRPRFGDFASTGLFVTGTVTNRSRVEQRKLTLFAVARRGGRVVAAGRGAIERLPARAQRDYRIFFIGNPRGARIEVHAPPTVLQ